ncbi:hypothetical protein PRVXH_000869 [Proteinivorax hydrogeniformans]|uniref:Sporulation membrane protein YtrI C-terminal domain-containing protein n=1 Tax=Proteinivorax hydrogeniformans TaxID=1826727 RepID=A0AAU8HW01_9FIRM
MRLLYFSFKKLIRTIGILLIGVLAGAVISQILQGRIIDELYIEKKQLQTHVVELQNTIDRLEDSQLKKQVLVVRELEVFLEYDDEVIALELKGRINELLNNLIGEEVDSINPNLVRNIVHNRTFVIEDRRYKSSLDMLIIAETTKVYIHAELVETDDPEE